MTAREGATVAGVLDGATRDRAVDRADASLLLAFVTGRSRAWLLAHGGDELDPALRARFGELWARRLTGVPVAYLTGRAWFYGREFIVDERVLIPRPETEHLVEDAIGLLRPRKHPRALDVGTGSGAIACSIAAELPQAIVDAVDLSPGALEVARANAGRLGVAGRVAFVQGDLLGPVAGSTYDAVVANLPYVPTGDVAPAPSGTGFEPRAALDGGPDGLDAYRRLVPALPGVLVPRGAALLEAAPPNVRELRALVCEAFPRAAVTIERDYGGRERYVKVASPA